MCGGHSGSLDQLGSASSPEQSFCAQDKQERAVVPLHHLGSARLKSLESSFEKQVLITVSVFYGCFVQYNLPFRAPASSVLPGVLTPGWQVSRRDGQCPVLSGELSLWAARCNGYGFHNRWESERNNELGLDQRFIDYLCCPLYCRS